MCNRGARERILFGCVCEHTFERLKPPANADLALLSRFLGHRWKLNAARSNVEPSQEQELREEKKKVQSDCRLVKERWCLSEYENDNFYSS